MGLLSKCRNAYENTEVMLVYGQIVASYRTEHIPERALSYPDILWCEFEAFI